MLVTTRVTSGTRCDLSGINAMELLINDLMKIGARRDRLMAKVFGGSKMIAGLSGIGSANAAFTLEFLSREDIPCVAQSLGGTCARHVLFWPVQGVAKQKVIADIPPEEVSMPVARAPEGNGPELF